MSIERIWIEKNKKGWFPCYHKSGEEKKLLGTPATVEGAIRLGQILIKAEKRNIPFIFAFKV